MMDFGLVNLRILANKLVNYSGMRDNIICGILVIFICIATVNTVNHFLKKDSTILLPEHPYYLLEDVNEEVLYQTLIHYEFPESAIITAQAVLETGNFKSRLCLNNNNLFGLYNSSKLEYYKFDSWVSCIFAYKKFILNKYKDGEDYYEFLHKIGYAEDPKYIDKVKSIELRIIEKYENKN